MEAMATAGHSVKSFLLGFAGQDIEDYASAVAYMESLPYVDPDRIGIGVAVTVAPSPSIRC